MRYFRKKPVVIEAEQLTAENGEHLARWCGGTWHPTSKPGYESAMNIPTLEGTMRGQVGDWIIRGVKGEFYPCKPDVFAATYEPAAKVGGESVKPHGGRPVPPPAPPEPNR